MNHWFRVLICCGALSGCAVFERPPCVTLDAQSSYCLQPPSALEAFSALQQVDVHWQQLRETTLADIENDSHSTRMVVLTPLGQKVLELEYLPPRALQLSPAGSPVDPALLLALVQLALWPAPSIQMGLRGAAVWQEQAGHRVLRVGGNVLLDIAFDGELPHPRNLKLRWPRQHLELNLRSLRDEDTL